MTNVICHSNDKIMQGTRAVSPHQQKLGHKYSFFKRKRGKHLMNRVTLDSQKIFFYFKHLFKRWHIGQEDCIFTQWFGVFLSLLR